MLCEISEQKWLALPRRDSLRFEIVDRDGLTLYETTYAQDSATVGCGMAGVVLRDFKSAFPGGLIWIARTAGSMDDEYVFFSQLLRAGGVRNLDWSNSFYVFGTDEYELCFAIVALSIMLGWDTNLVLSDRRYLVVTDDEPFLTVICDASGPWFQGCVKSLEFKVRTPDNA